MFRIHVPGPSICAVGALLGCLFMPLPAARADDGDSPGSVRKQQLTRLVLQECGSCHGMRLTGGLGPPLTHDVIAGKPRDAMVATIIHGRLGTPMPPWSGFLTESDARWIVDRLQEGALDAR